MKDQRARARIRGAVGALLSVGLALVAAGDLTGQQLPIRTAVPSGEALLCEPPTGRSGAPTATDAAGAERMTHAATQAMLLGDLDGAMEFLDRALAMDPGASEAVYLKARIRERQGDTEGATTALCQYLRTDPSGPSSAEVRRRLDEARDQGAAQPLLESYRRGLALEQEGRLEEAEAAFTEVIVARPMAAVALYNRGLVRLALGRDDAARGDLQRYLVLVPDAPDAQQVRQFLGPRAVARGTASGTTAFLAGAVLPGGGQFYTERPRLGAAILAAAGGALAAGLLYERTTVYCLDAELVDCPEELVASRETDRPLMAPALGIAAGVALAAAVEALMHVRRADRVGDASGGAASARVRLLADAPMGPDGAGLRLGLRLAF